MSKISRLSVIALLLALPTSVLRAQYTVNVPVETAFAKAEYIALGSRPTPIPVPHLNPANVVGAMANPEYLPTGSTPFTFVIAHRGSHSAPGCAENSACAIAAAYEAGADAIELDIKVTADNGPVLGHDVAIARELNNWLDSEGNPVTRSSAWTPFSDFPILDYSYLDLLKYPFLNNFKLLKPDGTCCVVDPNNPTRSTMNVSQIQNGVLVDTYDQPTGNHQLTLYEALYIITQYYPMTVWLDVKNYNDLIAIGPVLTTARRQMGATGPLATICLKLGWSTVSDSRVNGNPAAAMGQSGIDYFLVFGTGDLDSMAVYDGQSTPTSPAQATSQAYTAFKQLCTAANGCLGAELSHKYPNAPTQGIYNAVYSADVFQLAGFHTVPQYSWYWQTLPSQKEQPDTYGRTFPRTDGSCCFALTDALNISQYLGSEEQDLRALYSWNESEFSTITTDEPLTVLRDLTNQGKRPVGVAEQIAGSNTSVPSGGASTDIGQYPDGLYYLQPYQGNNYLMAVSGSTVTLVPPGKPTAEQMWYLSGKQSQHYTITNAATDQSIELDANNNLTLGKADNSPGYLWSVLSYIQSAANQSIFLTHSGLSVMASSQDPYARWTLVPVTTPSSESSQQQRGPAGYTYCADGDLSPAQVCNFVGTGDVAYGANGSFRYRQFTSGPVLCELSNFNNINPAPNVPKACFYAPYDKTWKLSPSFTHENDDGETFEIPIPLEFAYGTVDFGSGVSMFTYSTLSAGEHTCSAATFGYDPAPGLPKSCYVGPLPTPGTPPGFSYCASEGQSCVFSGTAAVAYGADGKFTYKTFTNGVYCGVAAFGLDPDPDSVKSCFYQAATPLGMVKIPDLPPSFQLCANGEAGTCQNIPQGSLVAYGASYQGIPSYAFKTLSGNFPCSLATFGYDPAPGVAKACYWSPQSWVNRGPVGFTFCAQGDNGSTCQFNGVAQVAYGADGDWVYKPIATNGIACNLGSFGKDPHPGYYKACYYRLY